MSTAPLGSNAWRLERGPTKRGPITSAEGRMGCVRWGGVEYFVGNDLGSVIGNHEKLDLYRFKALDLDCSK